MTRWAYLTGLVVIVLAFTCAIANGGGDTRGDSEFLLAGAAQNAQDPENPANDVVKIDNTILPGQCVAPLYLNCTYGAISRVVNTRSRTWTTCSNSSRTSRTAAVAEALRGWCSTST